MDAAASADVPTPAMAGSEPAAATSSTASAVATTAEILPTTDVLPTTADAGSATAEVLPTTASDPAAAASPTAVGAGSSTVEVFPTTEVLPAASAMVSSVGPEGSVPETAGIASAAASASLALPASGSQDFAGPGHLAPPSLSAPAVAGTASVPMVWTVDLIREHGQQEQPKQAWTRNNEALKWFRWRDEKPAGVPSTGIIRIDLSEPFVMIGVVDHEPKCERFSFTSPAVAGREQPWSWKQFLLGLKSGDFQAAVGSGIVGLAAFATPNSYDHNRHHAQKKHGFEEIPDGVRAPIWDFKITRSDGSEVLLHPRWRGNQVGLAPFTDEVAAARADVHPPKLVLGGTEGPGTFQRYLAEAHPESLQSKYEEGLDPVRDAHRRAHLDAQRQQRQGKAAAAVAASGATSAASPAGPPVRQVPGGVPPPPPGPKPASTGPVPQPPTGSAIPAMPKRPAPTLAGTASSASASGGAAASAAAAAADGTVWKGGFEYWEGTNSQWFWKDPQSGRWHKC